MTTNIKYKIDTENEIIYHSFIGDIVTNNLIDLDLELTSDSDYSSSFDQVYDLRYCDLRIEPSEIEGYIKFLKKDVKVDEIRKEIFLTDKPNQVALSTLYSSSLDKFQFHVYVVSTIESAMKILSKSNLNKNTVIKTLDDLRNSQFHK